jgi:hypothetical protein
MIVSCRAISYILALCMAVMLFASLVSPANGSFFRDQFFLQTYTFGLNTVPVLWDGSSNNLLVTRLDQGSDIVTIKGQLITVTLMETDPYQNWQLMDAAGVNYTGNDILVTYPVQHQFDLKAIYSCPVRFRMIDDRDGKTIKTFDFYLVVAAPVSGLGWPEYSPDCVPSFVWPIGTKF